jgi:rod shape-determining protein MreD
MVRNRRDYTHPKHIAAAVGLIVLTALLQVSDGLLPRPFGAAAFLLIPAVVCCAMFENETAGLMYGLLAGLLWDCTNLRLNLHAILLCIIGCAVSAIIRRKMRNTLTVAMVLSGLALFGYLLADWISSGHTVSGLLHLTLPSLVYSLVLSPIYYGLFRLIGERWKIRTI